MQSHIYIIHIIFIMYTIHIIHIIYIIFIHSHRLKAGQTVRWLGGDVVMLWLGRLTSVRLVGGV